MLKTEESFTAIHNHLTLAFMQLEKGSVNPPPHTGGASW